MKSTLAIICLVVFALGCATTQKYEAMLGTWVGQDENKLYEKWGVPDQTFNKPNGEKMIVYQRTGATTTQIVNNFGSDQAVSSTAWCKTTFIAKPEGVISSWLWEGNACRSK